MNIPQGEKDASFDHERAEALLAERLEYVTESIQPALGYEVQVDGVDTPDPFVWDALETFFDTALDKDSGASFTLEYDPSVDQLVLKELQIGTKYQNGPVHIFRTQDGYVPVQTIDTAKIVYNKDDVKVAGQWGGHIKPDFGVKIMDAFGISDIPRNQSDHYQLWLSQTLGSTSAWRLTESAELPLAITETAVQSVIIKKETVVGQEADDYFISRSLTERIVQPNPVAPGHITNESTLELSGDIGQSYLRHYLNESVTTPQSPLYQDFDIDEEPRPSVPIGEAEYSRFKKKLEEVSLLKHRLSQLDKN